jgi:uncharacterized protein (UPF0248 family)
MPRLLRSSETMLAIGSTIELDSGEVISTSIARSVLVTLAWRKQDGFLKRLLSGYGQKLYYEDHLYKNAGTALTLRVMYPEQATELNFKNPVLAAFSNAVWHCATAAKVCIVINEAASKSSDDPENAAVMASMWAAYQAAQNWSPSNSPVRTYNVAYSDGTTQEIRFIPSEIDRWVRESNKAKADENNPHRIVRVVDQQGRVVWRDN